MKYRQPQIFYICKPNMFFLIYDQLSILCLVVIFVSWKCLWHFTSIYKYSAFNSLISSFTSMTTYWFLLWQTYSFSLIMPISFGIVQTCIIICICDTYKIQGNFSPLQEIRSIWPNLYPLGDSAIRVHPWSPKVPTFALIRSGWSSLSIGCLIRSWWPK